MMVFDSEWFEQYQERLLRFANTRIGRRVLRIHGRRSGVGQRKIIKIQPHAITWENGLSLSTEFRTHAKYSKRLYHAFKPLWWTMHAWDMAIANNLRQSLNLGFDTLVAYPDSGAGNTTVDGATWFGAVVGDSYSMSTIRSLGATERSRTTSGMSVWLHTAASVGTYDALGRIFATFDTSSLTSTDVITSASIDLYVYSKSNAIGSPTIHLVQSTQAANNELSIGDHNKAGSVSFSSKTYAAHTLNAYATYALNSTGLSNIQRGGVSKFAARTDWDLTNNYTGSFVANEYGFVSFRQADSTAASTDPFLTVNHYAAINSAPSGGLLLGGTASTMTAYNVSLSGGLLIGEDIRVAKVIAPVAGKEYVYRVYTSAGTFLGVWPDVSDDLEFTQRLNTPGTTTTVRLARSARRTVETREQLTDQTSDPLTTEDSIDLIAVFETSNTVGENTDVEMNHNVDVYAHYGGFEELTTQDGELLTTEDAQSILVSVGAPLGRRVFSGFIVDYSAAYGESEYIVVTLASHGFELSQEIIKSGANTTRTYTAQNHDVIVKSILDTNPGSISYSVDSIGETAVPITETFRLNTKLEGIESVYGQSPEGWYWYGDVGENILYLQDASAVADHVFVLGKHIRQIQLARSIEDLRNEIWFVGGDTGGGVILYKKYEDAGSQSTWRKGIHRITDRRFTVAANSQKVAEKVLSRYKNPIYTTTVSIPSEVFDIETIRLGQMVGFSNFGNFVDSLLLQVVSLSYSPNRVTLELGELLMRQQDIVDKLAGDIEGEQYVDIPNAPA